MRDRSLGGFGHAEGFSNRLQASSGRGGRVQGEARSWRSAADDALDDQFDDGIATLSNTEQESSIHLRSGDIDSDRDGDFIANRDTEKSLQAELERLDQFARDNPGEPISSFILSGQFEIVERILSEGRPALPTEAPELWKTHRIGREDPSEFIRRVYGKWCNGDLSKSDIRRLDPPLYAALAGWLRYHEWPSDLDLPTKKQRNDRWVARLGLDGESKPGEEIRDFMRAARSRIGAVERRLPGGSTSGRR